MFNFKIKTFMLMMVISLSFLSKTNVENLKSLTIQNAIDSINSYQIQELITEGLDFNKDLQISRLNPLEYAIKSLSSTKDEAWLLQIIDLIANNVDLEKNEHLSAFVDHYVKDKELNQRVKMILINRKK